MATTGTSETQHSSKGLALRGAALAVGLLVVLWAILFAAIPWSEQEFPLNDDWCYALGAFRFVRGNGAEYFGWSATPLLGQWLVATPWIWLFGESLSLLRVVGIAFGCVGLFALYDIIRTRMPQRPMLVGFAVAAFGVCPLFFLLSGTFMTDVPSLALCLAALAMWNRTLSKPDCAWCPLIWIGALLAILAVINRQNTIAAPAAMAVALLAQRRLWRIHWILALALPTVAWAATVIWFRGRADVINFYPEPSLDRLLGFAWAMPLQIGLMLIPVWAIVGIRSWRRATMGMVAIVGMALLWAGYRKLAGISISESVPFVGNTITPWGALGFPNLIGGRPALLTDLRLMALVVGIPVLVSGGMFLAVLWDYFRQESRYNLLPVFAILSFPFMMVASTSFDRYMLFLMPGALFVVFIAMEPCRMHVVRGASALAIVAAVSLLLAQDWLAWNAARWELGRRAIAQGIPVKKLEGGFEWNGYHSQSYVSVTPPTEVKAYALVNQSPPNTEVLDSQPFRSWLRYKTPEVYLVRKTPRNGKTQSAPK